MKTTTNNHKIRVLQITGTMNMGGQETFIMNLFRNIDRDKFEFDFAIHDKETNYYEKEIRELGGNIIRLTPISKSPFRHYLELSKVLKSNHYHVVHRHGNSGIILVDIITSYFGKIPVRIAHSHSTFCKNKPLTLIAKPLFGIFATNRLACGEKAGKALFNKKSFKIVNNGINIKKFYFSKNKGQNLRKKYGIKNDCTVLMTIGRLEKEKNQSFLIDVFENYHEINPNSKLIIIGDGTMRKELENKVKNAHLNNEILILHNRDNISDFYNLADAFLLTSLFEGMPTVSIEAQVNGLKCFFSDVVTKEADHSGNTKFISLKDTPKKWATIIANSDLSRKSCDYDKIKKYDIENVAQEIGNIYLKEL